MKAFWAARSKIINKINHKKYIDLVQDFTKKYRTKILGCVCKFKIFPETNNFHSYEIIELPCFENRKNCWVSNEYQKASSFRKNKSGIVDLILVLLGDATK